MKSLSAKELVESGLLFEVNRTMFWPLGLSLAAMRKLDDGSYDEDLFVVDREEVILPDGDDLEKQRAASYVEWAAERQRRVIR